ncbi:MAG TPA: phosphatidate cytidylyltransferase [Candidatus Omnitrophota bacterium]|nr:phosphatidate cytidylyltransferase [Candidatus Omnitrophota bacterium]
MLGLRTLSALVMAPPALLAVWWGGFAFAALVSVAAFIMCWEWHRMIVKDFGWSGRVAAIGCAGASLLAMVMPMQASLLVVAAAVASTALAPSHSERLREWAGIGALYAGLPAVALVWLRGDADLGRETIFWLFLVVWATDTGAYGFGRLIGGPKLMPAVSPKKTWAGLVGGMLCSALVGFGVAAMVDLPHGLWVALGSAGLAVVAQAGDLTESWVKRKFGVKDSSNIIPGHGGVLDRVDGLLAVAAAVALATWSSGVMVLMWR